MDKIVSVLIANLYEQSTFRSQMVSQLLLGTPVQIIEKTNNNWLLVKGPDNYEGFVHLESLSVANDQFELIQLFKLQHTKSGYILPNSYVYANHQNTSFFHPNTMEQVFPDFSDQTDMDYLNQFLNAPYLWGGKSVFGLDCSGLSQAFFERKGLLLPRNSYMQGELGTEVKKAAAGDLTFFKEGDRIDHVGIMLNAEEMIHSRTSVHVNNIFDKTAKNYSNRLNQTIVFTKRYF